MIGAERQEKLSSSGRKKKGGQGGLLLVLLEKKKAVAELFLPVRTRKDRSTGGVIMNQRCHAIRRHLLNPANG